MPPVLRSGRKIRRGRIPSFPKDPAPNAPLSSLEGEILSVCLRSQEDPREIGILPALLSVERRGEAP